MPMTCFTCSGNITKERFPGIKCSGACENLFHVRCAKITDELLEGINNRSTNWLCETCGDVSSHSIIEFSDSESNPSLVDIMRQLKKMEKKLSAYDELMQAVDSLKSDNTVLQSKIQKLEEQLMLNTTKLHLTDADVDKQNQLNNSSSIVITGLPMKHGDVRGLIVNTLSKLDPTVVPDDILSFDSILRSSKKTTQSTKNTTNKFSNAFFIVKLKSTNLQQNILTQMRKKKSLFTSDLDVFLPQNHLEQRIFIMHHLTRFQTKLYLEAKNIKTKFNYKYLWVKAGQIYLRKTAESDVHRIYSLNDIFLLAGDKRHEYPAEKMHKITTFVK